MIEIAGRHINPENVERVEPWAQRTKMDGAVWSKGCIIYFTSGRKWKCPWPTTQVAAILGGKFA